MFRAILIAFSVLVVGCGKDTPLTEDVTEVSAQVSRRVDVGGHSLYIKCSGSGSPTVILESGLGSWSQSWNVVQPEVAKFARVCSYDRAGHGQSDSGPVPRTGLKLVEELNRLLTDQRVNVPYVFVGHSFGGLLARLFTHQYPAKVAGMVLEDSSHEEAWARYRTFMSQSEYLRLTDPYFGSDPEANQWEVTSEQVSQTGDLGSRPLYVLTRGESGDTPPTWMSSQTFTEMQLSWTNFQERLAGLSTDSKQDIVRGAGHGIHQANPQVVITAIREVVEAVRQGTRLAP